MDLGPWVQIFFSTIFEEEFIYFEILPSPSSRFLALQNYRVVEHVK